MRKKFQPLMRRHRKRVSRLRNHPLLLPVSAFLLLFIGSLALFVVAGAKTVGPSDSHIVYLYIDGQKQIVPSRAATVGDLLHRTKITLGAHDVVEPAATAPITDNNFSINIYHAHPVTIVDSGQAGQAPVTNTTYTAEQSANSIAKTAGYTVYPQDRVEVVLPSNVSQQGISQQVVIQRATPVTVNLYGTPVSLRVQGKTVAEVLANQKIKLQPTDSVSPAASTLITPNAQIFVLNKDQHIITQEQDIPNDTQSINDPNLNAGTTTVVQAGSPGKRLTTYEVNAQTGQPIGNPIQVVVASQPVTQIVHVGTKVTVTGDRGTWLAAAGVNPADYSYVDYIVSRESGWCPTKWQGEHACTTFHGAPSGGVGYGLCQSTPASKMASAGGDWASNPVTQLRWCSGYASRYGGWFGAYEFWASHGWW